MKIAMVFDGIFVGGIERVGADYAKILRQFGHQVTIINLRSKATEMEYAFPQDVPVFHVDFPTKLAPESYAKCIRYNYIRKLEYPIMYTALTLENAVHRAVLRRRPELKEEYDLAIAFSGHLNDLTFVASHFVRAKKTMCWLHGALYSYILLSDGYLNLYRKIKNLVVLVDDAQEEVLCYNPYLDLNINKVYNPTYIAARTIDMEAVNSLRQTYGKFIIMVSRFNYPHKDHYTVAKAFSILRQQYHDDLNLLFIGSGPEEDKVRQYVQSLGRDTAEHIHFVGTQTDVQNFYTSAFLLVHASVAGEGLPTIMLEALAYNLPMVVTDSKVGPREILRNDEYGLLCRVQDPEDMAEKIHRLCNDEALYRSFQEKSKYRICDFSPEIIAAQINAVIENIMNV